MVQFQNLRTPVHHHVSILDALVDLGLPMRGIRAVLDLDDAVALSRSMPGRHLFLVGLLPVYAAVLSIGAVSIRLLRQAN